MYVGISDYRDDEFEEFIGRFNDRDKSLILLSFFFFCCFIASIYSFAFFSSNDSLVSLIVRIFLSLSLFLLARVIKYLL